MRLTQEQIDEMKRLHGEGATMAALARQFGISRDTVRYHVVPGRKATLQTYRKSAKYLRTPSSRKNYADRVLRDISGFFPD